jgi:hypothetical protein
MSVFTHFPSGGISIVGHISSGGWEIDKYSDGRWRGEYQSSASITFTASHQFSDYFCVSNSPKRTMSVPTGHNLKVTKGLVGLCLTVGGANAASHSGMSNTVKRHNKSAITDRLNMSGHNYKTPD